MLVRDVMTRTIVWVKPDTPILEVMKLMRESNLGFIVIMDKEILGVITDRDIVISLSLTYKLNDPINLIMKKHLITIEEYDDINDASDLLGNMQVRRLLVINSIGSLVGIISIADLARHVLLEDNALEALTEISYDLNPKTNTMFHIETIII